MPIQAYALVALFLVCSALLGVGAVRLVARAGGPPVGDRAGPGDRALRLPGGAAGRPRDRIRRGAGGGGAAGRRRAGAARSERASALVAARLVARGDRHAGSGPVRVRTRVEEGI